MQSNTWAVVLESGMAFVVNRAHFVCVKSMTMMESDGTMPEPVSSLN
jgi:hypothetical protein